MDNLNRLDAAEETKHQRVQSATRRLGAQGAMSTEDLHFLEELFLRLDVTEKKLEEDISRSGKVRDNIRSAWQKTIKPTTGQSTGNDFESRSSEERQINKVITRKAKLLANLELAVNGSLSAREALKGLVATYYADRLQETNSQFHFNQQSFKTEFGIEVITSADKFNVRKLDALLVLDFKAPAFNTGYFGIDRAVVKFIPILTRLLSGDTIDHVESTHPLLAPAKKGGYTKDQLQTILTKLVEYQRLDQQRRLDRQ